MGSSSGSGTQWTPLSMAFKCLEVTQGQNEDGPLLALPLYHRKHCLSKSPVPCLLFVTLVWTDLIQTGTLVDTLLQMKYLSLLLHTMCKRRRVPTESKKYITTDKIIQ